MTQQTPDSPEEIQVAADKLIWTAPVLELLADHGAIQQHIPATVSDGIFSS